MSETVVIPPRTFREIPGTDVDIAVDGGETVPMDVTGHQSDNGAFRVEVTLQVGDTTITLRVPRGQQ